jgi:hypothetical protein
MSAVTRRCRPGIPGTAGIVGLAMEKSLDEALPRLEAVDESG